MHLVGKRSVLRFFALLLVYAGFAYVAVVPDAGILLRFGCVLVVLWATFQGVDFLRCVRRWRLEDDVASIPTLFNHSPQIGRDDLRHVRIVGGGPIRFTHGLPSDPRRGFNQLTVNMFVSDHDLKHWLGLARQASSED